MYNLRQKLVDNCEANDSDFLFFFLSFDPRKIRGCANPFNSDCRPESRRDRSVKLKQNLFYRRWTYIYIRFIIIIIYPRRNGVRLARGTVINSRSMLYKLIPLYPHYVLFF